MLKIQYCLGFVLLTQTIAPPFVKAEAADLYQIKDTPTITDGKESANFVFDRNSLKVLEQHKQQFTPQIRSMPALKDSQILRSQLPNQSFTPIVKRIDNYWSNIEETDTSVPSYKYVSGSVSCSGSNKVVAPEAGQAYAYLEFSDGSRWVSGRQMVKGGCGVLKSINGGREPVGRLVYGTDAVKIVLDSVDETTERATFSAYMRICAATLIGKTCSPYFIKLPWFSVSGNNFVAIGRGLL